MGIKLFSLSLIWLFHDEGDCLLKASVSPHLQLFNSVTKLTISMKTSARMSGTEILKFVGDTSLFKNNSC